MASSSEKKNVAPRIDSQQGFVFVGGDGGQCTIYSFICRAWRTVWGFYHMLMMVSLGGTRTCVHSHMSRALFHFAMDASQHIKVKVLWSACFQWLSSVHESLWQRRRGRYVGRGTNIRRGKVSGLRPIQVLVSRVRSRDHLWQRVFRSSK